MRKNKTISQDNLAIDAILAVTCGTGSLDPDVTAKEAEALGGTDHPLTRLEKAAFAAQGGDMVASLHRRVEATERRGGVGFVRVPQQPVYAVGTDQEGTVARSPDKLRRARKRMKEFLGE